jgi:hypothetical protein
VFLCFLFGWCLVLLRYRLSDSFGEGLLGPEWLKQISKMKFDDSDVFALPPDIELSVEDAKRI